LHYLQLAAYHLQRRLGQGHRENQKIRVLVVNPVQAVVNRVQLEVAAPVAAEQELGANQGVAPAVAVQSIKVVQEVEVGVVNPVK
jgi:hypothetical protein